MFLCKAAPLAKLSPSIPLLQVGPAQTSGLTTLVLEVLMAEEEDFLPLLSLSLFLSPLFLFPQCSF